MSFAVPHRRPEHRPLVTTAREMCRGTKTCGAWPRSPKLPAHKGSVTGSNRQEGSPMGRGPTLLTVVLLVGLVAQLAHAQQGPTQAQLDAAASDAADWLLPNHDYGGQR